MNNLRTVCIAWIELSGFTDIGSLFLTSCECSQDGDIIYLIKDALPLACKIVDKNTSASSGRLHVNEDHGESPRNYYDALTADIEAFLEDEQIATITAFPTSATSSGTAAIMDSKSQRERNSSKRMRMDDISTHSDDDYIPDDDTDLPRLKGGKMNLVHNADTSIARRDEQTDYYDWTKKRESYNRD